MSENLYGDAEDLDDGYDASNPVDVNAAKRDAGRQAAEDREVMKQLTDFRPGRAFLWRLLERCHLFEASFGEHAFMAFREGERNVGLQLFEMLGRANPVAYNIMLREHAEEHY